MDKSAVGSTTEKNSDSRMQQLYISPWAKIQLSASVSPVALETFYPMAIARIHSLILIVSRAELNLLLIFKSKCFLGLEFQTVT